MPTPYTDVVLFASAARTATANSNVVGVEQFRGILLTLNITAVSGTTPSMTVKVQEYDSLSDTWNDITGASFAAKTAAGTDTLKIYPGIAETANRKVSNTIPSKIRAVATITGTTPSFTFTLGGTLLV